MRVNANGARERCRLRLTNMPLMKKNTPMASVPEKLRRTKKRHRFVEAPGRKKVERVAEDDLKAKQPDQIEGVAITMQQVREHYRRPQSPADGSAVIALVLWLFASRRHKPNPARNVALLPLLSHAGRSGATTTYHRMACARSSANAAPGSAAASTASMSAARRLTRSTIAGGRVATACSTRPT